MEKIKSNETYQISIITYFVGMLEFLCLCENGSRATHANFGWGYYHGLFFLFLSAMILFYETFKQGKIWYKFMGVFVYLLHLISGIYYFLVIFLGGYYR